MKTLLLILHPAFASTSYRKSAFMIVFICASIIVLGQNSNARPERKYMHVGGFEHVVKSKLILKKNGRYKIRQTSAQFGTRVRKGEWKISGDTLILNQNIHFNRAGFRKRTISENKDASEKFKITIDGLRIYNENGIPSDSAYYKP